MDKSALINAEYWLSVIAAAKLVAAFLVAIGVAIEFGGDWAARPFEKTISNAKEQQLAALRSETIRLSADADSSRAQIANAQARAAEANQKAEEERLARVKIEKILEPRSMTEEQKTTFVELLKPFRGTVASVWRFQTASPETASFTIFITESLQGANWDARGVSTSLGSGYVKGVIVLKRAGAAPTITSAARVLIDALNSVQITAFPAPDFSGTGGDVFANGMIVAGPPPDIIVFVGDKP